MTPARLQTIKEIFHAALDCEPDQLNAFLDETCAGDEVLHANVEALLASHQQAGSFIETPVAALAASIVENGRADLLIGQTIGHYKISKRIGSGGMGEVYLASDISAGREAALKLLPTHLTGDAERLKRFQQEARAVAGLNHPNILTVYEVGADSSTRYIASELIEGETLRQRLARGSMQLNEVVEIAIQVAGALAAAHQAGIVHRDVKPENIMLRPDGYVKVLDFGIAKLAEQEVPVTMTEEEALLLVETNLGSILGTVRYMSPEQARGAPVERRTDIWSLGVVLYEMATGRAPFTGDTPKEVMTAILAIEPPPLRGYMAQAPGELQQIVSKALRKDPEERYQSAKEILEALKGLRHKLEFTAELKRSAITRWIRSPTALALTLLAGALALAFPFYWHRNPTMNPMSEKSIAVLPFENLSSDKENAFFTDGIQEETLTQLAKISALKVISRTSTQRYQSKPGNVAETARQLGVANILEGSVQRSADQVRVNVQLIKAATDTHLWADTFDRKVTDVFAVESEIAKAVADTLQAKLSGAEQSAIAARPTENSEAHDLYLRGRYFFGKRTSDYFVGERTGDDLKRAIDYFNQAIAKDPNYAPAYAGLADSYALLPNFSSESPAEVLPKAKLAVDKAVAIDDNLAEAHVSRGLLLWRADLNLKEAKREFERAIQLNPNYAPAHYFLAVAVLAPFGQFAQAIAELKHAVELDPFSMIMNGKLGYCYFLARHYPEAIVQFRKTTELDPNFPYMHTALGEALELNGDSAGAMREYEKAYEIGQDLGLALLAHAYALKGDRERAFQLLGQLQDIERRKGGVEAYSYAIIHLSLGENSQAIDWLERSYRAKELPDIGNIKVNPMLDPLRGDPRFEKLANQVVPPDVR